MSSFVHLNVVFKVFMSNINRNELFLNLFKSEFQFCLTLFRLITLITLIASTFYFFTVTFDIHNLLIVWFLEQKTLKAITLINNLLNHFSKLFSPIITNLNNFFCQNNANVRLNDFNFLQNAHSCKLFCFIKVLSFSPTFFRPIDLNFVKNYFFAHSCNCQSLTFPSSLADAKRARSAGLQVTQLTS